MSSTKSPNKGLTPSKIVIDEVKEMTPEQLGTIVKDVEAIKEANAGFAELEYVAPPRPPHNKAMVFDNPKRPYEGHFVEDKELDKHDKKSKFTHDELLEALYWMHQIFERANMTMVLIRETGEAANNDRPLTGDGVYVAARKLEWDSGARGVIDSMAQFSEWTDELVTYMANNGVPVYVKICEDDYCISSPDQKLYMHEYVKLPNPFNRFEEVFGK